MKIDSIMVGPIMTNCYLLSDETAGVCALIDPGDDAARVEQLVRQSGCALKYILLTHGHFDHMLSTFQHIERLRKFSLQTEEDKSVCGAHTRILEAVLHGTEEDVSRALSEHLHRYKLSVDQARAAHPDYFIGNGDTW